jgi:hypothetical protein
MGKEHFGRPAMNIRVYIVTEGQTETNFINKILGPYFQSHNMTLISCTVVTKSDKKAGRQYKGGISRYSKAKNDIVRCLAYAKKDPFAVYVSTMFDFYRLPNDFPGYSEAQKTDDPYLKVEYLEKSLQDDICKSDFSFLPYLSLHEFEALLFSDIDVVQKHFFGPTIDVSPLVNTVSQYPNPELINSSEQTSPSKRILQCVPEYAKPIDGVEIAKKIGLDVLRAKCRHFDSWIRKLEGLETSRK